MARDVPILVDTLLGSEHNSQFGTHYFMIPPQDLILTHWPIDSAKQFLCSPLSLKDLQPIIPVSVITCQLGLLPFNWSEVIKISRAGQDPVACVSLSMASDSALSVTATLAPFSAVEENHDQELQHHTFISRDEQNNEWTVQAALPAPGAYVLNIFLDTMQYLCLSYVIESEVSHSINVGYPYIFPQSAKSFNFVPIHWNNGKKSYNCVHSGGMPFSIVFKASADVSFHHGLMSGKVFSPGNNMLEYNTLLIKNSHQIHNLLVLFPHRGWWTICVSGTRAKHAVSGYTSVLIYHVFAEEGSEKLSYPKVFDHSLIISACPVSARQNILTKFLFASRENFEFFEYMTFEASDGVAWRGYTNVVLDVSKQDGQLKQYILNILFPKPGTWFVHVFKTCNDGNSEGLFQLKVNTDDFSTANLVHSTIIGQEEYKLSLVNDGTVDLPNEAKPISFDFVASDPDIKFIHRLISANGSVADYSTYLTRPCAQNPSYNLSVLLPEEGKWTVEVFAYRSEEKFDLVLSLDIDTRNPLSNFRYPKTFPAFDELKCKLSKDDALIKTVSHGEFNMHFQAPLPLYFHFKLENQATLREFSQQAFVHALPDSHGKILRVIFPECGNWKLYLHAKLLDTCREEEAGDVILLEVCMYNDRCGSETSFPLLYEHFHTTYQLHFKQSDLPLPSTIWIGRHPEKLFIKYYSPPNVYFKHYAEVKPKDDSVPKRELTRMVSNDTGWHQLSIEVGRAGCWSVFLYATQHANQSEESMLPVMQYTFRAAIATNLSEQTSNSM